MKIKNYIIGTMVMTAAIGCVSCNDEWEDEQFSQLVSFKAEPNAQGVTTTYVRYVPGGVRRYELPIILSGSTMNTHNRMVHIAVDNDTLGRLNYEHYGDREEIYFRQMPDEYYDFPETVQIPAGECQVVLPIDFRQGGVNENTPLDQADKWVLPLTIVDNDSYDYSANHRKWYRKALLRYTPFNDYSGTYDGTQLKITMEGEGGANLQVKEHRSFVVNENTIFFYMGHRDIDYLDRKLYKVFVEFTDEEAPGTMKGAKKLKIWTDNPGSEGNNFTIALNKNDDNKPYEPYYVKWEEMDATKPYMKHIYILISSFGYTFEDYTTAPGTRIKYTVTGSLSMQRDLNTLIPDEDQQIQW